MIAVNEIMSTARVTVGPTAFIGDLLALFDQNDFNAFPVLDERERLVGIVSKLDVLQLFLADHLSTPSGAEALGPARVADLMRQDRLHRRARVDRGRWCPDGCDEAAQPSRGRTARRPGHSRRDPEPGRCSAGTEISARRG
jgi:hypothetical protein